MKLSNFFQPSFPLWLYVLVSISLYLSFRCFLLFLSLLERETLFIISLLLISSLQLEIQYRRSQTSLPYPVYSETHLLTLFLLWRSRHSFYILCSSDRRVLDTALSSSRILVISRYSKSRVRPESVLDGWSQRQWRVLLRVSSIRTIGVTSFFFKLLTRWAKGFVD